MDLWIISAIIIVVAVVTIVGVVKLVKARAKRKADAVVARRAQEVAERPVRDWMEWMESLSGSEEDFAAVGPPPAGWEHFENVPELLERQKRTKDRLAEKEMYKREIKDRLAKLSNEPDVKKRCMNMFFFGRRLKDDTYTDSQLEQQRLEITSMTVTALLEDARSGDRESFVILNDFTREGDYGMSTSPYYNFSGTFYEPPDDWNELVVKFDKSPKLEDFRNIGFRRSSNQLKLLAAEALRCQSLIDAQIVLAFCSDKGEDQIGSVLSADLAKMIDAIHADRKMFSAKSTETRP